VKMADPNDSSLQFFSKATPPQWSYVLQLYSEVLRLKAQERSNRKGGPEELIKLDTWYQEQLPKLIHSRKDPHLIHEELVQVMRWKLMRGKYRPRLIDLVRINTESSVAAVTKKAFRKLRGTPNLASAIQAMVTLKGIGPATASAVLAAGFPEYAPYMADESMLATPGVEANDYTLVEYTNYAEQIKQCTDKLKELDPVTKWNPHKVELALWTHYLARELKPALLENMPPPDATTITTTSQSHPDITSTSSAAVATNGSDDNGNHGGAEDGHSHSNDEINSNSVTPPSDVADGDIEKSNDSLSLPLPPPPPPVVDHGHDNNVTSLADDGVAVYAKNGNGDSCSRGSGSIEEDFVGSSGIDGTTSRSQSNDDHHDNCNNVAAVITSSRVNLEDNSNDNAIDGSHHITPIHVQPQPEPDDGPALKKQRFETTADDFDRERNVVAELDALPQHQ